MIRCTTTTVLLLLAMAGTGRAGAQPPPSVPCTSQTPGGDYLEISCSLAGDGAAREWLFRADFTGVHDDSVALLAVRIDGEDRACGPGSTTALLGEGDEDSAGSDGFLECRIALEAAGATRLLWVQLRWRHARYVKHELVANGG